ncbi:carboxylesterase [Vararia minispora EC-137]|uniref:Carboxylesterase n=1 Tax=Vararia minispora EC-137 TaxID=1314806 RepID=A0ACB8QEG6_9AGAM|nr:carboxylesterase [Vararia minispora EC-137]
MSRVIVAALSLSLGLLEAARAATTPATTILFQNNGNWTEHGSRPSAILLHEPVTLSDASDACAALGEALLDCTSFPLFAEQLSYQAFLGNIQDAQSVWPSCATMLDAEGRGRLPSLGSDETKLPAICTNSAPFTDTVLTDFSTYPTVNVTANGTAFTGVRDHMGFRFMGVPYAAPPVGDLRFAYTQPFNGTRVDATVFKSACLQFGSFDGNASGLNPWGNSEDCLFLNVFTPFIPGAGTDASVLKPVMLWIHGGANINGVGSDSTFDGGSLTSRSDVVLVTINYRLNIFGYLSLDDAFVPGSFALADKIAALEWVRDHIAAFGGDSDNVIVFGQSAGGWSVIDVVKSPKARGLLAGAIVHSGGAGNIASPADAAAAVLPTISQLCNQTGGERLACLRALPAETLLNLTQTLSSWPTVIDGVFSTNFSLAQLRLGPSADGSVNPVRFMAGFMPDEGQSLLGTQVSPNETSFEDALATMVKSLTISQDLADAVVTSGLWNVTPEFSPYNASQSVDTDQILTCDGTAFVSTAVESGVFPSMHVYSMKRAYGLTFFNPFDLCTFPVGEPDTPYYLCHSGDLYEVFGTYYIFSQPIRVSEDVGYTNLVQDMWGAFARTGNPNPSADYLTARGYASTLEVVQNFSWPTFSGGNSTVAALQFPAPGLEGLPDLEKCEVVLAVIPVM